MTHDELLAEIDQWLTHSELAKAQPNKAINVLKALRAVVELHKPISTGSCQICVTSEGHSILFPCPTIQAIERELG